MNKYIIMNMLVHMNIKIKKLFILLLFLTSCSNEVKVGNCYIHLASNDIFKIYALGKYGAAVKKWNSEDKNYDNNKGYIDLDYLTNDFYYKIMDCPEILFK